MQQNPLVYLFRKVWQYSAGNRKNVVRYWLMFIIANAIGMVGVRFPIAKVLDVVQKEGISQANVARLIGLLMLPIFFDNVFWALHGPARVIERENAFHVGTGYRCFLLQGVMGLPMDWHVEHHTGDTTNKVRAGVEELGDFAEEGFQPISTLVELAVSYAILAYFSRPAGIIVLAMFAVTIWIVIRFDAVMMEQYDALNQVSDRISESTVDAISNITTIIILRVEHWVFKAVEKQILKAWPLFRKNIRLNEWKWYAVQMCCTVTGTLVMIMYVVQHIGTGTAVLVGDIFLLWTYSSKMSSIFNRFADNYSKFVRSQSRIINAERLAAEFRDRPKTVQSLPEYWERLCVEKLDFSYHTTEGAHLHLDDIRFCIQRGERIAFIGGSGSGKSTLLMVMRDIYHPKQISLSIDGRLVQFGFGEISSEIALVPQDPEIFQSTVLENITIGADWDLDIVRHYTDLACITQDIEALPHGFDSSIKEKGVNLSGGQKQRLALARGLLACRDKSIILLDEPTSSIDVVNETRIYENIFREFSRQTIISSIHKLHLLPMFDRIFLFDKGRIITSGTFEELRVESSEFQELWRQYHEYQKRSTDFGLEGV